MGGRGSLEKDPLPPPMDLNPQKGHCGGGGGSLEDPHPSPSPQWSHTASPPSQKTTSPSPPPALSQLNDPIGSNGDARFPQGEDGGVGAVLEIQAPLGAVWHRKG